MQQERLQVKEQLQETQKITSWFNEGTEEQKNANIFTISTRGHTNPQLLNLKQHKVFLFTIAYGDTLKLKKEKVKNITIKTNTKVQNI